MDANPDDEWPAPGWMDDEVRALWATMRPATLRKDVAGHECPYIACRGQFFGSPEHVLAHLGEEHDAAGFWTFAGDPPKWVPALLATPVDQSGGWLPGHALLAGAMPPGRSPRPPAPGTPGPPRM